MINLNIDKSLHSQPEMPHRLWQQSDGSRNATSIWVACNDDFAREYFERLADRHAATLLYLPDSWLAKSSPHHANAVAAIGRALEAARATELIVCGHARCSCSPDLEAQRPLEPGANDFAQMLARMRRRAVSAEHARTAFIQRLRAIRSLPDVRRAYERGSLIVEGLYYVPWSGALQWYDESTRELHSCLEESFPHFGEPGRDVESRPAALI